MPPRYRIVLYQKTDNVSAAIIMEGIEISEPSKGINTTKQAWGRIRQGRCMAKNHVLFITIIFRLVIGV